ncbi:hypothetical protein C5167_044472 [Papaver somniferum]|uniref:Uncharacterized protein n=1 Tax=Papaver somniferum TaxID=3469 RepID=A0A4Y7LCJ0_PAPSO|nr:hypothetical protein C5167_044472 [Papaver somniferum]
MVSHRLICHKSVTYGAGYLEEAEVQHQ